jgi:hypothetical protein
VEKVISRRTFLKGKKEWPPGFSCGTGPVKSAVNVRNGVRINFQSSKERERWWTSSPGSMASTGRQFSCPGHYRSFPLLIRASGESLWNRRWKTVSGEFVLRDSCPLLDETDFA